jgi:hypothetical protein
MADPARLEQPTNSKRRKRPKLAHSGQGIVVICAALVLGVSLLVLAVPRTVAAWTSLGVRPAMAKLEAGEPPTVEELTECVEAGEEALRWTRSSVRLGNLGSCEFALARAASTDASERAAWLARAEEHTQQSLIENPADGFAWTRLALMRRQRGAGAREICAALIMSLDMTPNARILWPLRSELLLFYAPFMTSDELVTMRHQFRTMWTYSPRHRPGLLEAAHRLNRREILTWALSDDREAMAEIEMMERQSRFP